MAPAVRDPHARRRGAARLRRWTKRSRSGAVRGHGCRSRTARRSDPRTRGRAGSCSIRSIGRELAGVDVRGDQYPYTASSTFLVTLLPSAASEGGVEELKRRCADPEALRRQLTPGTWGPTTAADTVIIAHADPSTIGRTVEDVAADRALDPFAAVCALVAEDPGAMVVEHGMHEDDVVAIMADPLIGVGSDNGAPLGVQHPRTWGCFPEFFLGASCANAASSAGKRRSGRPRLRPRSSSTWRTAARSSGVRSRTSASSIRRRSRIRARTPARRLPGGDRTCRSRRDDRGRPRRLHGRRAGAVLRAGIGAEGRRHVDDRAPCRACSRPSRGAFRRAITGRGSSSCRS